MFVDGEGKLGPCDFVRCFGDLTKEPLIEAHNRMRKVFCASQTDLSNGRMSCWYIKNLAEEMLGGWEGNRRFIGGDKGKLRFALFV